MRLIFISLLFISLKSIAQPAPGGSGGDSTLFFMIEQDSVVAIGTPFITSGASGTLRNDFTGYVGYKFTTSGSITVTQLGRWVVSGNSGTHTLKITDVSNSTLVSATINTSGLSVGYNYVSVTPTVLLASHTYYIFSDELNAGDQWYSDNGTYTVSTGTLDQSAYILGTIQLNLVNRAYVPVNFKY